MLHISLAVLHLLALGIGLGAIFTRARSLRRVATDMTALHRAFTADAWWGVAAILWITTGLWRALAGTEKSPLYYAMNHVFYAKMGLLALVLALELWPMVTLVRWRLADKRGTLPSRDALDSTSRKLALTSDMQLVAVVAMVVAAVMMARGYGAG